MIWILNGLTFLMMISVVIGTIDYEHSIKRMGAKIESMRTDCKQMNERIDNMLEVLK